VTIESLVCTLLIVFEREVMATCQNHSLAYGEKVLAARESWDADGDRRRSHVPDIDFARQRELSELGFS
jgi:hypothetical protein